MFSGIPGCGGLFTTDGSFSSPRATNLEQYRHLVDCTWVVRFPPGEQVKLSFSQFDLENSTSCVFDFVEVRGFISLVHFSQISSLEAEKSGEIQKKFNFLFL